MNTKLKYTPILLLLLAGCASKSAKVGPAPNLIEARVGFQTKLEPPKSAEKYPLDKPPAGVFTTVKYSSAAGDLAAYLTPNPKDGKKHPAIIWITGGDCNSIGDVWTPQEKSNDQSAAAYRKRGIVMMFPSLRGGNENPGVKEGFLGEVDDVLSAADYLEKQPYVDKNRIYLGGHSTGGTLALLVSESTDRFKGVFCFGPVYDVAGYGADSGFLPFNIKDDKEVVVRSPGYWLNAVKSPTWVIEGAGGNIDSLEELRKGSTNPNIKFIRIEAADHFNNLASSNDLLAQKILSGTEASLTQEEVESSFAKNR